VEGFPHDRDREIDGRVGVGGKVKAAFSL